MERRLSVSVCGSLGVPLSCHMTRPVKRRHNNQFKSDDFLSFVDNTWYPLCTDDLYTSSEGHILAIVKTQILPHHKTTFYLTLFHLCSLSLSLSLYRCLLLALSLSLSVSLACSLALALSLSVCVLLSSTFPHWFPPFPPWLSLPPPLSLGTILPGRTEAHARSGLQ